MENDLWKTLLTLDQDADLEYSQILDIFGFDKELSLNIYSTLKTANGKQDVDQFNDVVQGIQHGHAEDISDNLVQKTKAESVCQDIEDNFGVNRKEAVKVARKLLNAVGFRPRHWKDRRRANPFQAQRRQQ